MSLPAPQGLYDPAYEHDSCGIGFVVDIRNRASRDIVLQGLELLCNVTHRGAVGADRLAGDGAGILIQTPDALLRSECAALGIDLPPPGHYGVGMVFLPRGGAARRACEEAFAAAAAAEGQRLLGWRDVPVDSSVLGESVKPNEPRIRQTFIARDPSCADEDAFERKLLVIRKVAVAAVKRRGLPPGETFYVVSLSSRTLCYKGMMLARRLDRYYPDLVDERIASALAMVHQRFSTNTFPSWQLVHPYRYLCHNGEINTVRGNINWMNSRRHAMRSPLLGDDLDKLWPITQEGISDSATFDNALELLVAGGYPLAHAMMLMIPEAWQDNPLMDDARRAFYEYHAAIMEPWDGPAAIAFTDGRQIGATLDRNGLRPARYVVTDDDRLILASEVGALGVPESRIVRKWRLQPGRMLLVDLREGRIIDDAELKAELAASHPWQQWLDETRIRLKDLPANGYAEPAANEPLLQRQQAFGYTREDIDFLMSPMAETAEEAIGSMGADNPVAVLSSHAKPLANYFRQNFAQVTNPAIDSIREQLVTSLISIVGPRPNLLDLDHTTGPGRIEVDQPILTNRDLNAIREIEQHTGGRFHSRTIDLCYPADRGAAGMEGAVARICAEAEEAVRGHYNLLILSDRAVDAFHVAVPSLLATGAVHHHLVRTGLRTETGLIVETGAAREVHQFSTLAGYGAEAINPWLAYETLAALAREKRLNVPYDKQEANYVKAIGKGLLKVMSKMGISTYQSYCGAQIFDAVGLSSEFVGRYFTGTATRVEGIGIEEIAADAMRRHEEAWGDAPLYRNALDAGGDYAFRLRGEAHMWTPQSVAKLQHAVRGERFDTFQEFSALVNEQSERLLTLRGLFEFRFPEEGADSPGAAAPAPIPIEEVEPAASLVKRFSTGAMSFGSISYEAHTTLAIAMNRIGGRSNTGEGGELSDRYKPLPNGDSMRSAIKQVASGRFGVTTEYLVNADELQIKIAQGAKPGEGGQLPGHKVDRTIARVRYSTPGVGLISPPPHHDIYSIEDLAQLVYDLKNVNPRARVSVKLVSEVGVGTVAAGVSKCHADHVTIAGHDGGTGASPLTSIKHAGSPWEIGLAETHQTLVLNGLRGRIAVQVDGGIRTGRDVVIGALLGADEFGFATAPLIAAGCIMMRKCHLNTCPVGVATQDPVLRERFTGEPEHVINYFFFVAEEVRALMARLGFRRFEDLVGQSQLLDMRRAIEHSKARGLDFSRILHKPEAAPGVAIHHCETQDHGLEHALDHELIRRARTALEGGEPVRIEVNVRNSHRTVGAMLSGEVAKRYGHAGLPDGSIHVRAKGTGGQSFGAFLARGIAIELEGDANDYVGKGLSGGRLAIYPARDSRLVPEENILIGNTVLYGAIAGECYFRGVAGERFAVRNSGTIAVVEGVGDHGCEYMTGGVVVVLGRTGRNFAAGMSGGIAYVYDEAGDFELRCNPSMVALEPIRCTAARVGFGAGVRAGSGAGNRAAAGRGGNGSGGLRDHGEIGDGRRPGRLPPRHDPVRRGAPVRPHRAPSPLHGQRGGAPDTGRLGESGRAIRQGDADRISARPRGVHARRGLRSRTRGSRALMGKPTGFLEYERRDRTYLPVEERVRSWREFVVELPQDELARQGGRCMDCGIPFCHEGCPVHNVIPDWNDLVYGSRWHEALDALHSTNNFPEVTGRVCPAPCEEACTLNLDDRAVTIKTIECSIADRGFRNGWVRPQPAARRTGRRVAVVGSGPSGLACAQQLARAGHAVEVLEKSDRIGGLLRYGIPDFKMEKGIIERRMRQMEAEGVVFRPGIRVGGEGAKVSARALVDEFDAVVLAGGAEQPRDLPVEGRDLDGVHFAMEFLPQQNRRVAGDDIPEGTAITAKDKNVVVIGGGDTGSDCIGTSFRQGARSVTQLEILPRPPDREEKLLTWPDWPLKLRTSSSQAEGAERDFSVTTSASPGPPAAGSKRSPARGWTGGGTSRAGRRGW